MNNCEIKSPPVFSQEIPKWDRNTYADGNAMGAVVEQLFNNTVYNKEELKEKVDTEGGDISETQVSVLDESTEAFPVPMSGDKAKGLWGKLKKWQQDCLAKFGNYVLTSMITNQHVNSTSNIPSSALVYLMQQGVTQLNRDIGVLNTKQVETANAINGKLSKSNNITHLSWDSKYNIPVLTVNNQNKLMPVTLDVTKQFITQIGIAYTDRWVLRINYWYNGAEHHATINVDHSD